jgi:hypothetical protein
MVFPGIPYDEANIKMFIEIIIRPYGGAVNVSRRLSGPNGHALGKSSVWAGTNSASPKNAKARRPFSAALKARRILRFRPFTGSGI